MKKFILSVLIAGTLFSCTGCSLGDLIDAFLNKAEENLTADADTPSRVYMDEIDGVLDFFDGTYLTLTDQNSVSYTFDVSTAHMECQYGIVSGDDISVIYEGKLEDSTDTGSVTALKVTDNYHITRNFNTRTVQGTLLKLTTNSITIRSANNNILTFPLPGAREHFTQGICLSQPVTVKYYGRISENSFDEDGYVGTLLKVLTVMDTDKWENPEPTEAPAENPVVENDRSTITGNIVSVSDQFINVRFRDLEEAVTLDASQFPCYLPSGQSAGTAVTVAYSGTFDPSTANSHTVLEISSKLPSKLKNSEVSSTVTGDIINCTLNVMTLRTLDGIQVFCNYEDVPCSTELNPGNTVTVTYRPDWSSQSNILNALRID